MSDKTRIAPALTPEETCEFCGSRAEIVRSSTPICAACYYDAADVLPREIAALLAPTPTEESDTDGQ